MTSTLSAVLSTSFTGRASPVVDVITRGVFSPLFPVVCEKPAMVAAIPATRQSERMLVMGCLNAF
jgi:hypothetical protein